MTVTPLPVRELIERSPEIQLARLDCETAEAQALSARGDFDLVLGLTARSLSEAKLSSSGTEDFSWQETSSSLGLGLKRKFAPGTRLDLSAQLLGFDTTSTRSLLPSRTQSGARILLEQPLLRGAGFASNLSEERRTLIQVTRYEANLEDVVQNQLQQTHAALLDLGADTDEVKFREQSLKSALETLRFTEQKVKAGLAPSADESQALASALLARTRLITARLQLEEDEDRIRALMPGFQGSAPASPQSPQSRQSNTPPPLPAPPSLRMAQADAQVAQLALDQAENELLPTLNLTIEASSAGLAVGAGDSIRQLSSLQAPSWSGALALSLPLSRDEARGGLRQAQNARTRALLEEERKKGEWDASAASADLRLQRSAQLLEETRKELAASIRKREASQTLHRLGKLRLTDLLDDEDRHEELEVRTVRERVRHEKLLMEQTLLRSGLHPWLRIEGCTLKPTEG